MSWADNDRRDAYEAASAGQSIPVLLCFRWMTPHIYSSDATAAQQSLPDRWAGNWLLAAATPPGTSVVIGSPLPPEHAVAPRRAPVRSGSSGLLRPRRPGSRSAMPGTRPKRRQTRLGTKWESRALTWARYGSILLACASFHLRKHESVPVARLWMHSWGSRGRRFKSGRPDQNARPLSQQ